MNTWLSGNYPIAMWNQFRSDVPRTNNSCEGYNSRLAKRALQHHLNIYALICLFQAEQINKEAYILQLESGQQPTKRRKQYSQVDNDLVKYGLLHSFCSEINLFFLFRNKFILLLIIIISICCVIATCIPIFLFVPMPLMDVGSNYVHYYYCLLFTCILTCY